MSSFDCDTRTHKPLARIGGGPSRGGGGLERESLPSIRRCYAALRVISGDPRALPVFDNEEGLKSEAERDDWEEQAFKSLRAALLDAALPLFDATESIQQLRSTNPRPTQRKQLYPTLTDALRGRWPDQVSALALVGTLENEIAWAYRGSGSALSVSEGGWVAFEMYLARAATALERAWELGPTNLDIPTQMMAVAISDCDTPRNMNCGSAEQWPSTRMATMLAGANCSSSSRNGTARRISCSPSDANAWRPPTGAVGCGSVLVDAHNLVAAGRPRGNRVRLLEKAGDWEEIEATSKSFSA